MNSVNKPSPFKLAVLNSTNPEDTMLRTFGENAHAALTVKGLGNSLLGLYDKFFQGISEDALRDGLRVVIEEARCSGGDAKRDQLINLFVMAFNVRWCRGGKGAKLAFYQCMKILYEEFPMAVVELIPLIPQYGYWKDLLLLVEEVHVRPSIGTSYDALVTSVWEIYAAQLLADYEVLRTHRVAGTVPTLSFAAKYAPRKGHHMDRTLHAVSRIAEKMFPAVSKEASTADITVHMTEGDADDYDAVLIGTDGEEVVASSAPMMSSPEEDLAAPPKKRYRQIVAALTQALDVPEVKMCSHRYAELNISSIPSRCLTRNQKALANETKNGKVRCPGDTDREQCRLNLIESVMKGKLKGGQNYPHEYVEKVSSAKTTLDCLILDAQWANMRENVKEMIRKRISTNQMASAVEAGSGEAVAVPAVDKYGSLAMGNVIPLSDVSGSMSGTPLLVSIGLGILLSELANGPFRDLVMTFTGSAVWENLGDCASFTDKVKKMKRAHWEGNTNFYNAMNRIADIVRQNRLSQGEIPNLLVISDMQFDAAGGYHSRTDIAGRSNWNIAYENVENIFDTIGREVHGKPLTPPRIIFWNVRANSVGFPVSADQKGVMLLSGYSPALMKFILSGELEQEVEVVDDRPDAKETLETEVGREDSKGGTGDDRDSDVVEVKKKKVKVQLSPAETLDKVLHEEALDPVRKVLENLPVSDLAIGAGSLLRRCGAQTNRGCGGRGRGRGSVRGRRGRGRR